MYKYGSINKKEAWGWGTSGDDIDYYQRPSQHWYQSFDARKFAYNTLKKIIGVDQPINIKSNDQLIAQIKADPKEMQKLKRQGKTQPGTKQISNWRIQAQRRAKDLKQHAVQGVAGIHNYQNIPRKFLQGFGEIAHRAVRFPQTAIYSAALLGSGLGWNTAAEWGAKNLLDVDQQAKRGGKQGTNAILGQDTGEWLSSEVQKKYDQLIKSGLSHAQAKTQSMNYYTQLLNKGYGKGLYEGQQQTLRKGLDHILETHNPGLTKDLTQESEKQIAQSVQNRMARQGIKDMAIDLGIWLCLPGGPLFRILSKSGQAALRGASRFFKNIKPVGKVKPAPTPSSTKIPGSTSNPVGTPGSPTAEPAVKPQPSTGGEIPVESKTPAVEPAISERPVTPVENIPSKTTPIQVTTNPKGNITPSTQQTQQPLEDSLRYSTEKNFDLERSQQVVPKTTKPQIPAGEKIPQAVKPQTTSAGTTPVNPASTGAESAIIKSQPALTWDQFAQKNPVVTAFKKAVDKAIDLGNTTFNIEMISTPAIQAIADAKSFARMAKLKEQGWTPIQGIRQLGQTAQKIAMLEQQTDPEKKKVEMLKLNKQQQRIITDLLAFRNSRIAGLFNIGAMGNPQTTAEKYIADSALDPYDISGMQQIYLGYQLLDKLTKDPKSVQGISEQLGIRFKEPGSNQKPLFDAMTNRYKQVFVNRCATIAQFLKTPDDFFNMARWMADMKYLQKDNVRNIDTKRLEQTVTKKTWSYISDDWTLINQAIGLWLRTQGMPTGAQFAENNFTFYGGLCLLAGLAIVGGLSGGTQQQSDLPQQPNMQSNFINTDNGFRFV